MQYRVGAGVVAGLIDGLVFGMMMQLMNAPTPEGGQMPMMAMVAKVVGSTVIGAIFAWLFSKRAVSVGRGVVAWGAVYGIVWWVAGGQSLMKYLSRIRCRRLLAC